MDEVLAERVVRLADGPAVVARMAGPVGVVEQVICTLDDRATRPHRRSRRPLCRTRLAAA